MNELYDVVEIEDERTVKGESYFQQFQPLRRFRGNYGVPRLVNDEVIKGFFYSEHDELEALGKLHTEYHNELSQHLPVLQTTTVKDNNLMYLKQPYIPGKTYEQMLQRTYSRQEKSEAFKQLLIQSLGLIKHSDKTIGIDGKPENWIYNNGCWTFVDTFPPFLIDNKHTFGRIFNKRQFEKDFATKPDKTYFRNPLKIIRRLWLKSEKFDSTLNYKKLSLDTVNDMGFDITKQLERFL